MSAALPRGFRIKSRFSSLVLYCPVALERRLEVGYDDPAVRASAGDKPQMSVVLLSAQRGHMFAYSHLPQDQCHVSCQDDAEAPYCLWVRNVGFDITADERAALAVAIPGLDGVHGPRVLMQEEPA